MLDHEGKEVPGNRGYKYFGAARDLPGVRELFEKERMYTFFTSCWLSNHHCCTVPYWFTRIMCLPAAPALRKTRAELMKDVDAEYYGYRDEDDGLLLPLEAQYEKQGASSPSVVMNTLSAAVVLLVFRLVIVAVGVHDV